MPPPAGRARGDPIRQAPRRRRHRHRRLGDQASVSAPGRRRSRPRFARLGFSDAVREITGGQGVDVVLNSLSGEAMERSLEVLQAVRPLPRARQTRSLPQSPHSPAAAAAKHLLFRDRHRPAANPPTGSRPQTCWPRSRRRCRTARSGRSRIGSSRSPNSTMRFA